MIISGKERRGHGCRPVSSVWTGGAAGNSRQRVRRSRRGAGLKTGSPGQMKRAPKKHPTVIVKLNTNGRNLSHFFRPRGHREVLKCSGHIEGKCNAVKRVSRNWVLHASGFFPQAWKGSKSRGRMSITQTNAVRRLLEDRTWRNQPCVAGTDNRYRCHGHGSESIRRILLE